VSELNTELTPEVVAACTAGAEEAAGALGRSLDGEFVVRVGQATTVGADGAAGVAAGPGLGLLFTFGGVGVAAVLPASSGLVPDWCAKPDATGESKLGALAQELSMLLLPESLMADASEAHWLDDLGAALERAGVREGAAVVNLELARGEDLGELRLLWPLDAPGEFFAAPPSANPVAAAERGKDADGQVADEPPTARVLRFEPRLPRDYHELPPNTRNVLRVMVEVSAQLASKKSPIAEIVELGPGSIITFDKSCDADLDLCVGGHAIAQAEAVKVGEKFGVRVRQMIMPNERFRAMLPVR
jgi:flagellar motor switch/type III secretory pathway protein FliN